jgi:hypothetical protein
LAYCGIKNAKITGETLGVTYYEDCYIFNYGGSGLVPSDKKILLRNCLIDGIISLPSNYSGLLIVLDCWSDSMADITAALDMGNSTASVIIRNFVGEVEIKNNSNSNYIKISLDPGKVILNSSVTNGNINISGVGILVDYSTGTTIDDSALISKDVILDNTLTVGKFLALK